MKHPNEATLALHAGNDLGWPVRWFTARHVARCERCRHEVDSYAGVREILPELGEMPDVPWNRIAAEMRANVRLGLAAGECVREGEGATPLRAWPLFTGARAAVACCALAALLAVGIVLERPTPSVMAANVPMVQATANGIEQRAGDQGFALMHVGARDVTHSVGAQGTMGASYLDASTGYVTMTKVYVE